MDSIEGVRALYAGFNARDLEGVLAMLADDVEWANGMDGGYVRGREGVRAYWTRQWSMVSPHVEPVGIERAADGALVATVRQTVFDLDGKPLTGQTHGLTDKTIQHIFHFAHGKVVRFDIAEGA